MTDQRTARRPGARRLRGGRGSRHALARDPGERRVPSGLSPRGRRARGLRLRPRTRYLLRGRPAGPVRRARRRGRRASRHRCPAGPHRARTRTRPAGAAGRAMTLPRRSPAAGRPDLRSAGWLLARGLVAGVLADAVARDPGLAAALAVSTSPADRGPESARRAAVAAGWLGWSRHRAGAVAGRAAGGAVSRRRRPGRELTNAR